MIFSQFMKKRERRRNIRVNDYAGINYQIANEQRRLGCRNKDISEGGISYFLNEHLKIGTFLKLWVYLSDAEEPVFVLGKLVWQKTLSGIEFPFEAGVEFKMIEEVTRHRLRNYLDTVYHNKKQNFRITKVAA